MTFASKKLTAAEIQFDKSQTAQAKKPAAGYETAALTAAKKIERLKALRLARDAAEAAARPAASEKKKRARKTQAAPKRAEENSATLTGWWKDQKEDGRNN